MKKSFIFLLVLAIFMFTCSAAMAAKATDQTAIDWNQRHDFAFHENLLQSLMTDYPDITKVYSIGHSWYERQLWCIELTSQKKSQNQKTPIAIFGNIHGGEQESGESASYTAWWLTTQYGKDPTATKILDNYKVYIVPIINPDGYVQSFIYPTRQNFRPTDHNGDGKVFSDPYTDTNGDGIIAEIYQGAADSPEADRIKIGMESPDWDGNGKPGDDWKGSNIDMNRTFDYMWNRLDVDGTPVLGSNSFARAGFDAASEPEVKAVQNFLITHPVNALCTLHTGIQCVLWPWCYTPEPPKDAAFMQGVAEAMAKEYEDATGRRSYTKQSYDDYPTNAELIDWSYGRLGIHSYTMEVYAPGPSSTNTADPIEEQCCWNNELPKDQWIFIGNWNNMSNIWFKNTANAQMAGNAPPEQSKMVEGTKNAMIKMIQSEPNGPGPKVPDYLFWAMPELK